MRYFIVILFLCLSRLSAVSQTSTVTAQIVDSDGIAWAAGTWTAVYRNSNPDQPPLSNGYTFSQSFSGVLTSTGSLTVLLTRSDSLSPKPASSSGWVFCATPAVSSPHPYCTAPLTITGSTQDVSGAMNAVISPPRLTCGASVAAYADVEMQNPVLGCVYFNSTTTVQRCYNGSAWTNCGAMGYTPVVDTGLNPAINASVVLHTIVLAGNTSPTVVGIAQGQRVSFQICQPATGTTTYGFIFPAAFHGAIPSGVIQSMPVNTCAEQAFNSYNGTTFVAEGPGVTGVAP